MLPGSVGAFDGRATGGRLGSPTIATIQLVLKRDEEAIDRTSALNEEQGFRATNCPDRVKLNARVRSIHASKPQMRLKERPAGERARKRVYETCSSQRVTHEVAHFIKWHGHDLLRNVSGLDFFLRALQRLQLTHMGSVSPATRRERAWTRFDGPLTCRFTNLGSRHMNLDPLDAATAGPMRDRYSESSSRGMRCRAPKICLQENN